MRIVGVVINMKQLNFLWVVTQIFVDSRLPDQIFLTQIHEKYYPFSLKKVLFNRVKVTRQPLLESKSPSGQS